MQKPEAAAAQASVRTIIRSEPHSSQAYVLGKTEATATLRHCDIGGGHSFEPLPLSEHDLRQDQKRQRALNDGEMAKGKSEQANLLHD